MEGYTFLATCPKCGLMHHKSYVAAGRCPNPNILDDPNHAPAPVLSDPDAPGLSAAGLDVIGHRVGRGFDQADDVMDLMQEVVRLKAAILAHKNQRGDDRCWLDDDALYAAAGLGVTDPYETALPPKCDFLASCERYWRQRQVPGAIGTAQLPGGMTIAQLTEEVDRLKAALAAAGAERDALLGLTVQEYRNGPLRYRVIIRGVWPGEPGRRETFAPGTWDANGDFWCYDRREDAVAAVRKAAGLDAGEGRGDG